MLTKCKMCNTEFYKKATFNRHINFIPDVCSKQCFTELLLMDSDGNKSLSDLVSKEGYQDFRSNYEYSLALWLIENGIKVEYEKYLFHFGKKKYLPDFYVPQSDTFLEVKGIWQKGSWSKFLDFKRNYSNINIYVVDKYLMSRVRCQMKKMI